MAFGRKLCGVGGDTLVTFSRGKQGKEGVGWEVMMWQVYSWINRQILWRPTLHSRFNRTWKRKTRRTSPRKRRRTKRRRKRPGRKKKSLTRQRSTMKNRSKRWDFRIAFGVNQNESTPSVQSERRIQAGCQMPAERHHRCRVFLGFRRRTTSCPTLTTERVLEETVTTTWTKPPSDFTHPFILFSRFGNFPFDKRHGVCVCVWILAYGQFFYSVKTQNTGGGKKNQVFSILLSN